MMQSTKISSQWPFWGPKHLVDEGFLKAKMKGKNAVQYNKLSHTEVRPALGLVTWREIHPGTEFRLLSPWLDNGWLMVLQIKDNNQLVIYIKFVCDNEPRNCGPVFGAQYLVFGPVYRLVITTADARKCIKTHLEVCSASCHLYCFHPRLLHWITTSAITDGFPALDGAQDNISNNVSI